MNCKVPIRTYGKKKCEERIIPVQKLHISTVTNNNSSIRKELSKNDSVFYDPFETTFDRLVKNTKTQTQPLKTYNVTAEHSSTDDSSNSSVNTSEEKVHYKCFLYDDIKLPNDDIKPVSKREVQCKKSKMQINTKIILKRNVSASQKNKKSEAKKNKSYKKYKLPKARSNKKTTSSNANIDSVNLDSHMNISGSKDCHNNYKKDPNKKANNKYAFRKNNKNSNILNSSSNKNLKIVPCSVTLDKLNILEQTNNNKNNFTEGTHKNILKNDESSKHIEITKTDINNMEHGNRNVKHCFVKMEQLEISSDTKQWLSGKISGNVISSTPVDRPVKLLPHLIALSPIPITYSEKLNESVTSTDSIPTSVNNKNNLVSLEFQQINEDSCGIKSDTSRKSLIKEKIELLPTCVTNTSKYINYNLDQSGKIKMENTNSLAILNCTSNNTPKHEEHLTQVTCEKLLDSVKNILTTEVKSITLDVSPELIQEHRILDVVKKNQLNFSIDVNRSLSLFGDTNGSTQTSLCKAAINITKVTGGDVILDETNKELSCEMYSDSIKLNKSSLSNVEDNKVEIKFDDTKEDLYEMFIPAKLMISNASSGDVEFQLETEGIDLENKNTCSMKETESLLDKNNTVSSNKSRINNDDSHCNAMEPYVVLNRLQDPIRITKKRKRYRKWELDMDDILENGSNSMQFKENEISLKRTSESKKSKLSRKMLKSTENIIETSIHNTPVKIQKPIYLKPGKSWARSLSILNNIQNESNLDRLSVGKGKKWKDIVLDVLNMQNQGGIHSCMRKTRSNKELQVINETINTDEHELNNNKGRTSDSTSLGRLTRRISVRVVPINKTIKLIEDAPFLEVYGIVPINSQRFTLISNPRKSSVCKIQNDDVDGEIAEEHTISTAKEVILTKCSQKDYIPFSTYFSDSYLEHCRKIGEGVYGEVFLHEYEDKKTVIKIIPIEGDEHVNGEPQKKFHEILSEIIIAMELHNLRFNTKYNTDGFVNVKNIKCLKGEYPKKLVELWNIYDEEKRSENDCPSMFNDDQLYIILELGHGGQDLEAFVFPTAEEAYILFIQAALSLAVAEKAIEFEHRDLHWGNVLISPTTESHIHYKLGQKEVKLISKGVKVSIIDFTLSRITYQECSIFNDLASDPSLFTAQGEYQFEIYRLMRDKIKNNWQTFEPYTNILWLHYTLDKMITAVRYRRRNLRIHKHGITKLKELKNKILTYSSAYDFVTNCDKVVSLLCNDSESDLVSALKEEMVIV